MTEKRIHTLVAQWKDWLAAEGYAEKTRSGYAGQVRFFVDFLQESGVDDLAEVTRETVHRYQMHLHDYRTPEGGKSLALSAQTHRLVAMQSLFRHLVRRGHLLADPTTVVEFPRQRRTLPKGILSQKEVHRVLQAPNVDGPLGLRNKAVLEVLYATGIRNAKLRHLSLTDVDTVRQELTVRGGKGGKDRVLPLGEVAARYVDQYLAHSRPGLLGGRTDPARWLFISKNGRKLTPTNLQMIVAKYVKQAGLDKNITPHSFRHTCATHMIRNGASLRAVQELLGHENIGTTQIYTHVTIGDLKREHRRTHPREQPR